MPPIAMPPNAQTALLLIDLQNDFLPGGSLAVPEGDAVIPIANRLIPHYETVVATQDWHPTNHGSFAANHPEKKPGDVVDLDGLEQILWPTHCVEGTPGAAFTDLLNTDAITQVFRKGSDPSVDSYSAFFDNGHRRDTGLAAWLRERGITELHIAGLATDYCVKFTVLDALAEGFAVTLLEDACRGVNLTDGDVARATEAMRQHGAVVR